MKKFILSIAVLVALSTVSCKKAYECTCDETSKTSYEALISAYAADAQDYNDEEAAIQTDESYSTVTTLDKTTKSAANANCTSYENTETWTEEYDTADEDADGNIEETAIKGKKVTTGDCSLDKQ